MDTERHKNNWKTTEAKHAGFAWFWNFLVQNKHLLETIWNLFWISPPSFLWPFRMRKTVSSVIFICMYTHTFPNWCYSVHDNALTSQSCLLALMKLVLATPEIWQLFVLEHHEPKFSETCNRADENPYGRTPVNKKVLNFVQIWFCLTCLSVQKHHSHTGHLCFLDVPCFFMFSLISNIPQYFPNEQKRIS